MRLSFILPTAVLLGLTGCAQLPTELHARSEPVQTDYSQWQQSPDTFDNVRVGGVIASIENLSDKTRIEIVNLPLNSLGKPDISQEPQGRYRVYLVGYVEPMAFMPGRLISVVGQSDGVEKGKVGDYPYTFPVLNAYGHRLWQVEERIYMYDFGSDFYHCSTYRCRGMIDTSRQGKVVKDVK